MAGEVGEVREFQQLAACGRMIDVLPLERPGKVMWDENGVEAGGEGWIDVRFRTVADHPRRGGLATMMRRETAVGRVMLLGQDLDGAEVRSETRTPELICLLRRIALGDEYQPVTSGQFGESFGDMGKQFDLLIGNGLRKADDAVVLLGSDGVIGKLLETGDQGLAKAVQSITTSGDGGAFDAVETFTDLFGIVDTVVEIGDEGGNCPLKIDVIFPKRIVCVDKQRLVSGMAGDRGMARHRR